MAGKLRSPAETKRREAEGDNRIMFGDWKQTEDQIKMSEVLGEIANEVGVDSIPAGTLLSVFVQGTSSMNIVISSSRSCLGYAQGTLCVPHRWWKEDRGLFTYKFH